MELISVVIPALNEEKDIESAIKIFLNFPDIDEVIVSIDPKTTDNTALISERCGAKVIYSNLTGFGAVVKSGILEAKNNLIYKSDADISNLDLRTLSNVIDAYKNHQNASLIKTFWDDTIKPRTVTILAIKPFLKLFFPELSKIKLPLSGFYLFDKTKIDLHQLPENWSLDLDILIQCYIKNLEIIEVEIPPIVDANRPIKSYDKMSLELMQQMLYRKNIKINEDRVMLVMAHSDDAEIWCGGTIARYCLSGGTVRNIVITSNEIRKKEAINSSKLLPNYEVDILNNEEFTDFKTIKMIEYIKEQIHYFKPNILITHYPDDFHLDHRNTSELVMASLLKLGHKDYPERVYFTNTYFEKDMYSNNFNPDTYIDISEYSDIKQEMIKKFKSQKVDYYLKMIDLMDGLNGFRAGVNKAESFQTCSFHLSNKAKLKL